MHTMQPHLDPTDCSQGREKKMHLLWYPLSLWSQEYKQKTQSNQGIWDLFS